MPSFIIPPITYNKNIQYRNANNIDREENHDLLCSWFYELTVKENADEKKQENSKKVIEKKNMKREKKKINDSIYIYIKSETGKQ